MKIFSIYEIKTKENGKHVVVRKRYNYPNEMRIVSEEFDNFKDAEEFRYALSLKVAKEVRKEKFKI